MNGAEKLRYNNNTIEIKNKRNIPLILYCISDFTTLRGNVNRKFEGRLMGSGFKVRGRFNRFYRF